MNARILGLILCLTMHLVQMQSFAQKDDARTLFESLKQELKADNGLTVTFTLTIDPPDDEATTSAGKLWQSGDKIHVDLPDIEVISDGESVWSYLKPDEIIQITNREDGGASILSPSAILDLIEDEGFDYEITGSETYEGIPVKNLEFKPTDRSSPYAKARIRVLKNSDEPRTFELFEKSGMRYLINIESFDIGRIEAHHFIFDPENYPDADIEDLRI